MPRNKTITFATLPILFLIIIIGYNIKKTPSVISQTRNPPEKSSQAEEKAATSAPTASANEASTSGPYSPTPTENTRAIDDRIKRAQQSIEATFATPIRGLHLPRETEIRLMQLLLERAQATYDASDAITDLHSEHPSDVSKAIAASQRQVEDEIRELVGDSKYQDIKTMMSASRYLRRIQGAYGQRLTESGAPLSPEQLIPIARAFLEAYGTNDPMPKKAEIDPYSGLSKQDDDLLIRAKSIISEQQAAFLRQAISDRNRKIINSR